MPEALKQTRMFRFDQMAIQVKDKIDNPAEADVDRYVGLEHIDPESLKIRRWGETTDVESSKLVFKFGDIIFGKRRAYQRKLAVADFNGICSAHAMVLRPKTDVVLEEFLPFFMQSDIFMDRAVRISVGGLSPTINWSSLAKEEFLIPSLEEQRRLVGLMSGFESVLETLTTLELALTTVISAYRESIFAGALKQCALPRKYATIYSSRVDEIPFPTSGCWHLVRADSFCNSVADGTHDTPGPYDGENGYPLVTSKNLKHGGIDWAETTSISESDYEEVRQRSWVEAGDILYGMIGTIGNPIILNSDETLIAPKNVGIFRFGGNHEKAHFFKFALDCSFLKIQLLQHAAGSTQQFVALGTLRSLLIPVPQERADLEAVVNHLGPVLSKQDAVRARLREVLMLKKGVLNGHLSEGEE